MSSKPESPGPVTFERDGRSCRLMLYGASGFDTVAATPADLLAAGFVPQQQLAEAQSLMVLAEMRAAALEAERAALVALTRRHSVEFQSEPGLSRFVADCHAPAQSSPTSEGKDSSPSVKPPEASPGGHPVAHSPSGADGAGPKRRCIHKLHNCEDCAWADGYPAEVVDARLDGETGPRLGEAKKGTGKHG